MLFATSSILLRANAGKRCTSRSSPDDAGLVQIGRVVGTFGLKGAIKVAVTSDLPGRFKPGCRVNLCSAWYVINGCKWHKGQARLFLDGLTSVEQAQSVVGAPLYAAVADRPILAENEFYVADLVGMEVFTEDGRRLGMLDEVIKAPAQDLLRVGKVLIPAVDRFVKSVDLASRRIVVELLPGMEESAY